MLTAFYNDVDPFCCAWLSNLMDDGLITPGVISDKSIADLTADDLRGFVRVHLFAGIGTWDLALTDAGWPLDRPVWSGSCPCPPFSQAGKKKLCPQCQTRDLIWCPRRTGYAICTACHHAWFADARHLWPEMWRLAAHGRPECCFGEQVASNDGLEWLAGVQASMEILGHAFGRSDYPAAGVGSPNVRQRLYWVADAEHAERGTEREVVTEAHGRDGLGGGSDVGSRMAHPNGRLSSHRGLQRGGEHGLKPQDSSSSQRLVDADQPRPQGRRIDAGEHADQLPAGSSGESGEGLADSGRPGNERGSRSDETHGTLGCDQGDRHQRQRGGPDPWNRSGFIPCTDGKFRRVPVTETGLVEPALFPLADAGTVGNRVATLRGSGNAINFKAASRFIEAFLSAERCRKDAA